MLSFLLTALYGILTALIGFQSQTTAFYEMITGTPYSACRERLHQHQHHFPAYLVPGNPVANMYGSLYGGQSVTQALNFLQDLKLGQYVKLAPRVTFCMQAAGKLCPYASIRQGIEHQPNRFYRWSSSQLSVILDHQAGDRIPLRDADAVPFSCRRRHDNYS